MRQNQHLTSSLLLLFMLTRVTDVNEESTETTNNTPTTLKKLKQLQHQRADTDMILSSNRLLRIPGSFGSKTLFLLRFNSPSVFI